MDVTQILELDKANKERFSDAHDYYSFLMYQLQSHLVEIDDLKTERDPHYVKEIADIVILAHLLAKSEGADDEVFRERYKRFFEKIEENKGKSNY